MRIIVAGFLAKPKAATESGTPYWWAKAYEELGYDVTLLTSESQRKNFDDSTLENPEIKVIFANHYFKNRAIVAPNSIADMVVMYFQIKSWGREAKRLAEGGSSTFVHHVTLSTIRTITPFGNSCSPVVWGPLGGGHYANLKQVPLRGKPYEAFRNLTITLSRLRYGLSVSLRNLQGVVLTTNQATKAFALRAGFTRVVHFLSDGVGKQIVLDQRKESPSESGKLNLLWAGRMVHSKRPDLALFTLKRLVEESDLPVHLHFAGDGPFLPSLTSLATSLGLVDSVTFHGFVPWEKMPSMIDLSHFILFTSMRDSSAPLVLEGAARGVPTVAVLTQSIESIFPNSFVNGTPAAGSNAEIANGLCQTTLGLIDPGAYTEASKAASNFSKEEIWEAKARRVLALVKEHFPSTDA